MAFVKYILCAVGLMFPGILSVIIPPASNPGAPPALPAATVTWVGGTTGFEHDWNTPSNWSDNTVPGSGDHVVIPAVTVSNNPTFSTNVTIQSLEVQANGYLATNGFTLTISGAGANLSLYCGGTIVNAGTINITATSDAVQLDSNADFFNNGTLNVTTTGNYGIKIGGSAVLNNAGTVNSTGTSGSLFFSGSNASTEMVKNYGRMNLTNQIEKYTDTFHNYPCGVVNLTSGEVYNNGGQIINEGFFSAPANLNGPAVEFINDGIVYAGGLVSYTNNKIRIYNNAGSTGIFEFGALNDLTVSGIYKDNAAALSAGDYHQATNTFTHFGLSAGSQTLYAKITRPGGTCPQIVPFTFEVSTASVFTAHPTNQTVCPGSPASFTVAIVNAASYQWQFNTGGGWNNVPAVSPYANVTTATLTISNVTGLANNQYRCVASSAGGATLTSMAATLTIGTGGGSNPTGTLTWTGAVDTDWNTPCNWSPSSVPTATNDVVIPNTTNKPIINTAAVAQSVAVQAEAILTINTTRSLTINGSKLIDVFTTGFYNAGTVHNNGQLILGNTGSIGEIGLINIGAFNNNAGAEIAIDQASAQGLTNNAGGIFTNAAKITIGSNASVGIGIYNSASFNNHTGGEITINRSNHNGIYNYEGGTFTNAAKIMIGTMIPTLANGINNTGAFINNAGGEITIDHTTAHGLVSKKDSPSSPPATFTNAGQISIGAIALQSTGLGNGNGSTFNNNTGGEIKIDRSTSSGLWNDVGGTFNNAATITIGATASVGLYGLKNDAAFNNSGGEIKIDNATEVGLENTEAGGTFNNAAKITIGAMAGVGHTGLNNRATFNNNTGGEITVNRISSLGLNNSVGSTFTNAAKIMIGTMIPTLANGIYNSGAFINNAGGEITIDHTTAHGLHSKKIIPSAPTATFTNAGKIAFGSMAALGSRGLYNGDGSAFNNNIGGEITIDRSTDIGLLNDAGGIFTNTAKITIGATASVGLYGLKNDGNLNNSNCGKLMVASGNTSNAASRTITNEGLMLITNTLENNGMFTNNGVLKYGSLTGNSVTNNTNPSLLVKDTPMPIFTYGGIYDGVVNGIFKDSLATLSAGTFNAPNSFTPSGLPGGNQTLYAKITPAGSGCTYIVPFTYMMVSAPSFTTHPADQTLCSISSVTFTVAAVDASSYQWQVSTNNGSDWTDLTNSVPYSDVTTDTLHISSAAGLNGYQFRCVAGNSGGSTNSDAGTLTLAPVATPTASVTAQPTCLTPTGTIVITAPAGTDIRYSINGVDYQVSGSFNGLAPESYSVTAKDTATGCISSSLVLTVDPIPVLNANISYPGSPYSNTGTASVTLTGSPDGVFSSTTGLSLNTATGEINLTNSLPGTYVVTYAIAANGGCSAFQTTAPVEIIGASPTTVIYVNANNANPTRNGASWATAFTDLQAGLSAAASSQNAGIQVWVAQGTYKPGIMRKDVFEIPSGVRVYGGFSGHETLLHERNWKTRKTILSGEIGTSQRNDNTNHVVLFRAANADTRLDGFTIERGYAEFFAGNQNSDLTSPDIVSSGGGILAIHKSRGLITNCIIADNRASGGGGLQIRDSSNVHITQSVIYGNEANFGGGVYVLGGSQPYFENVLFAINKGLGGAVYVNRSQPVLVNCTIASNKDEGNNAGGIFNANAVTTIQNSILWGNTAPQSTPGSSISYSIVEGGFAGTTNLSQNPRFVNPNANGLAPLGSLGDYHLQNCSPAINAGHNTNAPMVDLDDNTRPYPNGIGIVDLGVYESQSSGSTGPANLPVSEPITSGTVLKAADRITAVNQVSGATVVYQATKSVTLFPGFSVTATEVGHSFTALIGGCQTQAATSKEGER